MKKAIEAFPISQEEAEDVDTLRDTFPDKSDLRAVLEDYFHIYDDYAEMTAQEFDRYFADYMSDYKESEFVEDVPLESSRKPIKSSRNVNEENIKRDAKRILDAVKYLTPLKNEMVESPDDSNVKYSIGEQLNNIQDAVQSILGEIGSAGTITASRKPVKSSKIGDVHDRYVRGEMTENQMKKELAENGYDDDEIEKLSEKWGRKVVKSALEEQQKQDLKESLIRAGYSEQEADSILLQAEQSSTDEQTF